MVLHQRGLGTETQFSGKGNMNMCEKNNLTNMVQLSWISKASLIIWLSSFLCEFGGFQILHLLAKAFAEHLSCSLAEALRCGALYQLGRLGPYVGSLRCNDLLQKKRPVGSLLTSSWLPWFPTPVQSRTPKKVSVHVVVSLVCSRLLPDGYRKAYMHCQCIK